METRWTDSLPPALTSFLIWGKSLNLWNRQHLPVNPGESQSPARVFHEATRAGLCENALKSIPQMTFRLIELIAGQPGISRAHDKELDSRGGEIGFQLGARKEASRIKTTKPSREGAV